jgi:Glutathione peroxidase
MGDDTGDRFTHYPSSFWEIEAKDIDGNPIKFESLKGKAKAYIVANVASNCTYTNQNYLGLTSLHKKYK